MRIPAAIAGTKTEQNLGLVAIATAQNDLKRGWQRRVDRSCRPCVRVKATYQRSGTRPAETLLPSALHYAPHSFVIRHSCLPSRSLGEGWCFVIFYRQYTAAFVPSLRSRIKIGSRKADGAKRRGTTHLHIMIRQFVPCIAGRNPV